MDSKIISMLIDGTYATLYMTFASTILATILGIPLGVVLVITDKDGICPMPKLKSIIGFLVNVIRSVPFVVLLILIIPFTRMLIGTTIGSTAAIVPLVISAAPYIARLVETALKEVEPGVIEAAQSMGASNFKIVTKVLLPEAKPALILAETIAITTVLVYSTMAGFVGGGGLGDIAVRYGYYRYDTQVMILAVIILVVIVQVLQESGAWIAKRMDKRLNR